MVEKKVFEGKTTNEAIEKGLNELKMNRKDVEIRTLENEDKRSFFNILAPRVVKVEISYDTEKNSKDVGLEKEEKKIEPKEFEKIENKIKEFLEVFFKQTNTTGINFELKNDTRNTIMINVSGDNATFLIGYRGEVLNAFQTYLISIAGKYTREKIHINLDVLGYREKRKKVLEDLAIRVANSVIKGKNSITLDPMTAYERKIIHTKLQENKKVKTVSIGEGENRRVVISLK